MKLGIFTLILYTSVSLSINAKNNIFHSVNYLDILTAGLRSVSGCVGKRESG